MAASDSPTLWTLEAWRGAAAWMVVYAHIYPWSGIDAPLLRFSFTGVDLFFVLSGFVFAPHLWGEYRTQELGPYAIRRLFRIYPAYLLALGLYVAMKVAGGGAPSYLGAHLLFAHLQSTQMAFYYNPAFWSLPAEVEFYLALPLLAALCRGKPLRLAGLLACAWALRLWMGHASDRSVENQAFIWLHHLPGMLLEFLLGAAAWRLSSRLDRARWRMLTLGFGAALWTALAALFARWGDAGIDASLLRGQMSWLAALAFAAMVAATARPPRHTPPPLIGAALWLGRLSYGTYLLHIAALQWMMPHATALGSGGTVLGICGLTLLGAWLLNQLWEEPWRRAGRAFSKRLGAGAGGQNTSVSPG